MTTAIQEYSATEVALSDLAQRFNGVVFDVAISAQMTLAKKGRAELRTLRTDLERKRIEIKAPALERCRMIDAEAKRITIELLALEEPIDATIKAEERRREAEKAERDRAEAERIANIQAAIFNIRECERGLTIVSGSVVIEARMEQMRNTVVDDAFAEFKGEAELAKVATMIRLAELRAAALAHEEEQRKVRADREELARLKAAEDKRQREAAEADAAKIRMRAEEEAAARKRIDDAERESRLRIEAEEAVAKVLRDEEAAKLKAEQGRIDADRRELEERQRQARLGQEERERADREANEAYERKQREEAEAIAKAKRDAEDALLREITRQQNEMLDARELLATFRSNYGHLKEFARVVKAIDTALAPKQNVAA